MDSRIGGGYVGVGSHFFSGESNDITAKSTLPSASSPECCRIGCFKSCIPFLKEGEEMYCQPVLSTRKYSKKKAAEAAASEGVNVAHVSSSAFSGSSGSERVDVIAKSTLDSVSVLSGSKDVE